MRVRVTCEAHRGLFPTELSRAFRLDDAGLVAGDAICRHVRARQGIPALKMALDSVEDDPEAPVRMARLAFSSVCARGELPAMGVLVAVCTTAKPRNVKTQFAAGAHRTRSSGVTCLAFDVRVFSVEGEFRSLVVERAFLCRLPGRSGMALVASAGELLHVRIAVARFTGRKRHAAVKDRAGVIHGAVVTLLALRQPVLSSQGVAGMLM